MIKAKLPILVTAVFLLFCITLPVFGLTIVDTMEGYTETVPGTNENGDPLLDESGQPIMIEVTKTPWMNAAVDKTEGFPCIVGQTDGSGKLVISFTPDDPFALGYAPASEKNSTAFSFLLKVNIPGMLESAKLIVEDSEERESIWNILDCVFSDEESPSLHVDWNHILCRTDQADQAHAKTDSIGKITLSFTATGPIEIKIGQISAGNVREFGVGSVQIGPGAVKLDGFDDTGASKPFDGKLDAAKKIIGSACLVSDTGIGMGAVGAEFLSPIDLTPYLTDGYLFFWLYVDKAENVGDATIELSSTPDRTANISGYDLSDIPLQDGWNEILLPLSKIDHALKNGKVGADMSKIVFFGVYSEKMEIDLRVDELYVGLSADFAGTPSIDPPVTETTDAESESEPPITTDPPISTEPPVTDPPVTDPPLTQPPVTTDSETTSVPDTDSVVTEPEAPDDKDGLKEKLLIVGFAMLALLGIVLFAAGLDRLNHSGSRRKKKKKSAKKSKTKR